MNLSSMAARINYILWELFPLSSSSSSFFVCRNKKPPHQTGVLMVWTNINVPYIILIIAALRTYLITSHH